MSVKNFVVGCFKDEKGIFKAVDKVRTSGYKLHNVYSPYPVHGLDDAMGMRQTSIHTAGFFYGLFGLIVALGGMAFVTVHSWPLNFDGKPHFPLPSFIPITFEFTVLISSVGMTLTFCWLNQIMPGVKKHVFHPRQTDDLIVMVLEKTEKTDAEELKKWFSDLGAVEISEQRAETGWWYGNYAKPSKFEKQILEEQPSAS
ncbi:MAG TPA: DUF3341 domain-containing protein [Chitinophagaceae bacterium]|nr:DUF3341 domain-containing protein [Chitinophagaceae bacterium]